jgi:xylan 1,4-beta-xylosidase
VDPLLKIGGPSTARAEWIPEFITFCRDNGLEPEYIIGHIYNNDSDSQPLSPFDGPQEDRISKSPHFASGVIRGTRKLLDSLGFKGEVHWNEWGRSWYPCEPLRETANEAAFIVKTMAEVSQLGDYFAYWCLSDIYDQVGYGGSAFHGNYGLLSLQGLRKPSYQAFQLLGRMGCERVPVSGEGLDLMTNAVATRSGDGAADVLVYSHDSSDTTQPRTLDVCMELPRGTRVRSLTVLSENENNIISDWREMGSPKYLKADVLAALRERNELRDTTAFHVEDGDDVTRVSCALPAPGIALLQTVRKS